jgi:hypothetical protein
LPYTAGTVALLGTKIAEVTRVKDVHGKLDRGDIGRRIIAGLGEEGGEGEYDI